MLTQLNQQVGQQPFGLTSESNEERQSRREAEQAELRRQLYERIARGHALADAEDDARHRWLQG